MATVMKTTRDVKGVGLSIPRPDGPGEGHRSGPVRRGSQGPRPAPRQAPAQSPRACAHRAHRYQQGARAARRAGRPDRRRHPGAEAQGPDAGPRRPRHRPRDVRRASGRRRGCRRAGHRRGGAGPDRGRVRRPARGRRSSPVHAARCPAGRRRGHRGRHQRGDGPRRGDRRQDGRQAGQGRQHLPAVAAPPRGHRPGLCGVRRHHREDVPGADGPPGLSRAARRHGPVGHHRVPDALGQHPGVVQHALGSGRRARDLGEPDQGHPRGVRGRLRRQDPGALRAHHGAAGPRHRPARPLRDDPARGAGGGDARRLRSSSA